MEDSNLFIFKTLGSVYGRTECYRSGEEKKRQTSTVTDQPLPKHEHHPLSSDHELSEHQLEQLKSDAVLKKEAHVYLH